MKLNEIIEKIENFCPVTLACEWDNVGLLVGDADKEVKKALITLDVDMHTVNMAVQSGVDIIISHHPMFFKGIKGIDYSTPEGKIICTLIKNDIAVYAAHTNMDCAPEGINERFAQIMELGEIEVLEDETGLGRTGVLKQAKTLACLAADTAEALGAQGLRFCGAADTQISKIAVGGGSCSDLIPLALSKGCDAIITSDLKYHEAQNGIQSGMCIIDAGHYYTERFVKQIFAEILENCGIELILSESADVFEYIVRESK